jgi:hypothetical protein
MPSMALKPIKDTSEDDLPDQIIRDIDMSFYFQPQDSVIMSQLQMSKVSLYSTTPWKEANFISRTIINFYGDKNILTPIYGKEPIITDATANVGGNTISFYLNGIKQVNAVEIDEQTCKMLKNNLTSYHLPTQTVHCQDYVDLYRQLQQDVVFLDPPWGGHNYLRNPSLDLYLGDKNIIDICYDLINEKYASLLVLKVPINFNLQQLIVRLPTKTILTHKIYRGLHHSYNVIFCW